MINYNDLDALWEPEPIDLSGGSAGTEISIRHKSRFGWQNLTLLVLECGSMYDYISKLCDYDFDRFGDSYFFFASRVFAERIHVWTISGCVRLRIHQVGGSDFTWYVYWFLNGYNHHYVFSSEESLLDHLVESGYEIEIQ